MLTVWETVATPLALAGGVAAGTATGGATWMLRKSRMQGQWRKKGALGTNSSEVTVQEAGRGKEGLRGVPRTTAGTSEPNPGHMRQTDGQVPQN